MIPHRRTDLGVFLLVTLGAAWLVALPLWFGDGLATPLFGIVAGIMMFTPSIGVLVVWLMNRRVPGKQWATATGLGLGERKLRTGLLIVAAWFGAPLFSLITIVLSVAFGLVTLDLEDFSLFRQQLQGAQLPMDVSVLVAIQIAAAVLIAPLLNAVVSFGEEWGWRGWLLPRLQKLGVLRSLLVSGVIWGVWHAPLTALGYNYPTLGPWAALMFTGFCVLFGVLIGWLRLYSGSVWPCVIAHGSFNASAGVIMVLGDAQSPPALYLAGPIGVVGLVVLAVMGALLLRFFPVNGVERDEPRAEQQESIPG